MGHLILHTHLFNWRENFLRFSLDIVVRDGIRKRKFVETPDTTC